MAKNMVKVKALKTATTTVRGERVRQNIVTNANEKAAKKAAENGEDNTHTFLTTPAIADQLVAKGVVEIVDEDATAEDDGDDTSSPNTPAAQAKKRVKKNAEADQAGGDSVSGADTRDTTAFATPPLEEATPVNAAPAGGDNASTADAPPAGDEDEQTEKKAPAKKAAAKKS